MGGWLELGPRIVRVPHNYRQSREEEEAGGEGEGGEEGAEAAPDELLSKQNRTRQHLPQNLKLTRAAAAEGAGNTTATAQQQQKQQQQQIKET